MQKNPLTGLQIMVNDWIEDTPRMRVSQRFAELMPAEFVDELQTWMTKRFGTEPQIIMMGQTVLMNQRTYDKVMRDFAGQS
jgi:hypothetical protein